MKSRLELKIAAVVGVIMLLICLFVLTKQHAKKNEVVDLKVYKHIENEQQRGYVECIITTEELSKINKEMKKVENLNDSTLLRGTIEGNYKIVIGDNFYAFDKVDDNFIFRSSDKELHAFEGETFEIVVNRCEG